MFADISSDRSLLYAHLPILLTRPCCVALASLEFFKVLGLNTYIMAQTILLTLNSEIDSGFQADRPYISASIIM